MKRYLFVIFLICASINCNAATYWLCRVKSNVNFRECPSTDCTKLCTIPAGSYVLTDFEDASFDGNKFVQAIYIDNDIYGYISSKFLVKERIVDVDKNGVFELTGKGVGYDPELKILNDTNQKITVKINETTYAFNPHETRIITCPPGKVSFIASSPGVIPYIGEDKVESNGLYNWKFFIRTRYR